MHLALLCLASLASIAFAGPPGDYGDAPVGNNGDGINAYPGVTARWVTRYTHTNTVFNAQHNQGSWLNTGGTAYAGTIPPVTRNDSAMNPGLPENDAAPVLLIWTDPPFPGSNPLAEVEVTVTTTPAHPAGAPVYLNIWIDQNRDGQMKDGYYFGGSVASWNLEWAVQDVATLLPPGTTARVNVGGIRLEDPTASVWLRVMVTDQPIGAHFRGPAGQWSWWWDGTMNAAHIFKGEIEDHLLDWQTSPPGPTLAKGVWYKSVYNQVAPPGGGAKPACDVFYKGPFRVFTPACPGGITFPLNYTQSERNGGCSLAPVLWGMYGLKHVAGIMAPPVVGLNAPLPLGSVIGANTMTCPNGDTPTLAANIVGEGPLMASMTVPSASITGPGRINIFACYFDPPKRFRAYRVFFHHFTCGSVHAARSVVEYPETGVTMAHAVVGGPGQGADYCDLEYGGLEEAFQDPAWNRPFPDPDFTDFTWSLHGPGSIAQLTPDTYYSAPTCMRLRRATYMVRPTFPAHYEAASVSLWYTGELATVSLVSVDGTTQMMTLAPADDWRQVTMALPDGFRLDTIVVDTDIAVDFDDIFCSLRELPAPPGGSECDPDVNCDGAANGVDVEVQERAVGGDMADYCQDDADFNRDGAVNGLDVEAVEIAVGGGPCP
ncbi:MAG: hypothetical protein HBSAPP03_19630 [Phycisphaerae bacterium]|nr:MAG: hypothetical protein HBSAPP03_19630 [Phycisphaerae bacterium]